MLGGTGRGGGGLTGFSSYASGFGSGAGGGRDSADAGSVGGGRGASSSSSAQPAVSSSSSSASLSSRHADVAPHWAALSPEAREEALKVPLTALIAASVVEQGELWQVYAGAIASAMDSAARAEQGRRQAAKQAPISPTPTSMMPTAAAAVPH